MSDTPETTIDWQRGPVPDRYRGLWRRRLLIDADGSRDADTIVWWLQTRQLFADIRLPGDRASLAGATCYADLGAEGLSCLTRQEGFAGVLEWTNTACAWRRQIDFRPLPGPPDEGWMDEAEDGLMIERGIHRGYLEEWVQSIPKDAAMDEWLWHDGWGGATVLRLGNVFMLAEDRRPAPPRPETFEDDVLAAIGNETALSALLDCEISYGRVEADGSWRIALSTIPWREGQTVAPL
ncbi:hypothetical protein EOI86_10630 [Hwanghaeella grinnelliae]|uniref:Uncharacterized protein n=1 Tax=Hwanghaeella grinnelliae TaxID=2500179 RepID=A0A3S3USN9_9PROT|nr:hypothetical protein [Hwanghaeella grinnelliae]RVU39651.1 hypothetical protein EOI86_10630 [Hwanghaeella grinnelliae]